MNGKPQKESRNTQLYLNSLDTRQYLLLFSFVFRHLKTFFSHTLLIMN